ncbi:hypothetical protein QVD17_04595 [Tagetes erecta]|uniref:Uncharacterized protein n=1 Tax=Tagetes erecta TaxID=13708 RepID=A0AAD8LAF7_TARER|nr:hypothetical protein QVD17_04595 [Tagetes erecta]
MATARPLCFLKSDMNAAIPFPAKAAYRRPCIVNYRQSYAVPCVTTVRGVYRPNYWLQNKSFISSPMAASDDQYHRSPAGEEDDGFSILRSYGEFRTKLKKCADKQSLPMGVAIYASYFALKGFIVGYLVRSVDHWLVPVDVSEYKVLMGDYYPLFISIFTTPFIGARIAAVYLSCLKSIAYFVNRLIGSNTVIGAMAGGIGAGVAVALVAGMRGPIIIPVAVFVGLFSGLCRWVGGGPGPDPDEQVDEK